MSIVTEQAAKTAVTAQDMIKRAYQILGDLGKGEALTADMATDGLYALNAMLDLYSTQKLYIYVIRKEALTWPADTTSRTIGSGADFDTHRPDRIENGAYFEDTNSISYTPKIVRNREVYDAIPDKTVKSSYPDMLFYEPTMSWGTIYLYPVPNQALTLYLVSWQPLQYFDTLTESHHMPPGYQAFIEYNLAEFLEPESGLVLPPGARKLAAQTKAAIKRNNSLPILSRTETAHALQSRGRSDIVAGQ